MSTCPANTFSYVTRNADSLWLLTQRFHTSVEAIRLANPGINLDRIQIGQILCIPRDQTEQISSKEHVLSNRLRMLWEQHVFWTRLVISAIAFDLPDAQFTAERLLRNPDDFGQVLRLFYGGRAAAKFEELFTEHLTIAAELVKAAKAGNTAAAADAEKRWYANADQIAAFFADINPYWSEQEWRRLLYEHLAMTKQEAVEILTQKYADSISTFDQIEREALQMADQMTQGIVKQFAP